MGQFGGDPVHIPCACDIGHGDGQRRSALGGAQFRHRLGFAPGTSRCMRQQDGSLQHDVRPGCEVFSQRAQFALGQPPQIGAAAEHRIQQRFVTGKRKKAWNKNCVSLGLASGFLEPLESTSIHLIHRGIAMLLKFFPDRTFEQADIDRYNKIFDFEFSRVRDFLLLHYTQTERKGPFWEHCRSIPFPDSLQEKVDLFRSHGRILREDTELFPVQSWLFVMIGQAIIPRSYDPLADSLDPAKIMANLDDIRSVVKRAVAAMPTHQAFIGANCSAEASASIASGLTVKSH